MLQGLKAADLDTLRHEAPGEGGFDEAQIKESECGPRKMEVGKPSRGPTKSIRGTSVFPIHRLFLPSFFIIFRVLLQFYSVLILFFLNGR